MGLLISSNFLAGFSAAGAAVGGCRRRRRLGNGRVGHGRGSMGHHHPTAATQADALFAVEQVDLADVVLAHQRDEVLDHLDVEWAGTVVPIISHRILPSMQEDHDD